MVIYEVNLKVNPGVLSEFKRWLAQHIAEIIALPGFEDAELFEPINGAAGHLCVRYQLVSEQALQDYLTHHAPHFREQGQQRFGEQFTAQRRLLRRLATYNK